MASNRRVVITGYGLVTPLGLTAGETFENCRNGKSGIHYISTFDVTGLPCQIGGEIPDQWIAPPEGRREKRLIRSFSRGLRLMKMAAQEASLQARLDTLGAREKIGVSLGSYGDNPSIEEAVFLHRFYDGKGHWDLEALRRAGGYSYFLFHRRKPDMASSILAQIFDCQGPNLSLTSACAAGAQAIGEAYRAVQSGECDIMLAGGCEATLTLTGLVGFILLKALAEKYITPQSASRPFDRKRNGFVLSEGAGAIILEEMEHASRRDVSIMGEILGYGSSADAYRITDSHPQGLGAAFAMKAAIEDAGLSPGDIEYINAHGTSTLKNDISETLGIKEVFGDQARDIPISSNKSMLGHCLAGSGAIEAVLTLMGMNRSVILPTLNYEFPDPRCDLWYVPNEAVQREHRTALSNSFGFGGQNSCLCFGRYDG